MIRKVRLNSQGYDRYGTYFGKGQIVWEYDKANGYIYYLRAPNREQAVKLVAIEQQKME